MDKNPEMHPDRYGGDGIYETKKVARAWHTTEEYRGWLLITIEKYCSRYGKKDERLKEARKIETYAKFLRELEEEEAEKEVSVNPEGNPKGPHLYEEKEEPGFGPDLWPDAKEQIHGLYGKKYQEQYLGEPDKGNHPTGECDHPSPSKLSPAVGFGDEECLEMFRPKRDNFYPDEDDLK